jgi:hypothetical protein
MVILVPICLKKRRLAVLIFRSLTKIKDLQESNTIVAKKFFELVITKLAEISLRDLISAFSSVRSITICYEYWSQSPVLWDNEIPDLTANSLLKSLKLSDSDYPRFFESPDFADTVGNLPMLEDLEFNWRDRNPDSYEILNKILRIKKIITLRVIVCQLSGSKSINREITIPGDGRIQKFHLSTSCTESVRLNTSNLVPTKESPLVINLWKKIDISLESIGHIVLRSKSNIGELSIINSTSLDIHSEGTTTIDKYITRKSIALDTIKTTPIGIIGGLVVCANVQIECHMGYALFGMLNETIDTFRDASYLIRFYHDFNTTKEDLEVILSRCFTTHVTDCWEEPGKQRITTFYATGSDVIEKSKRSIVLDN